MINLIACKRHSDNHGSGAYNAPRGARKHKGVDYAAWPESMLISNIIGTVTRLGYCYSQDKPDRAHFKLIEITTPLLYKFRFLYVSPHVIVGQEISKGDKLGTVQDLTKIYTGITPHVHVDIQKDGEYINPETYYEEFGD